MTLSPSGQAIAFTGFPSSGAVTIWQDGSTTAVPNTGSNLDELQVGALLWGYTYLAHRLRHDLEGTHASH